MVDSASQHAEFRKIPRRGLDDLNKDNTHSPVERRVLQEMADPSESLAPLWNSSWMLSNRNVVILQERIDYPDSCHGLAGIQILRQHRGALLFFSGRENQAVPK